MVETKISVSCARLFKVNCLNDTIVTHWGWRYSAADRLDYEPVKRVSERAMQTSLNKLLRMYVEQDFPLTKDDFKCSYCDYMDLCPKYKT